MIMTPYFHHNLYVGSDGKFNMSLSRTVQNLQLSILISPSKMSVSTRETYRFSNKRNYEQKQDVICGP